MSNVALPSPEEWGHRASDDEFSPDELVRELVGQTEKAIYGSKVRIGKPEGCKGQKDYCRVSFTIPVIPTIFDQLMNGANGYRAHYSVSIEAGEEFNRRLVQSVGTMIVFSEETYRSNFDRYLCNMSLLGEFSHFWFPEKMNGRLAARRLRSCEEALQVPRWIDHWKDIAEPRKGLIAPSADSPAVQLYGTFIDRMGNTYDAAPNRARNLYETGWS